MMKKSKLAKAIAYAVAGIAMAAATSASASNTMYNLYNASATPRVTDGNNPGSGQTGGTDGWVWGGPYLTSADSGGQAVAGWVGTASTTTNAFGSVKAIALNWGAHITNAGDSLEISQADSFANYGVYADIDTAGGAWHQSVGNGWRHNIDIGLFKSDVTQDVTLNIEGINSTIANFGITVYKGLSTNVTPDYSHHGPYNGDSNINYEGMAYEIRTLRDAVTKLTTNQLTFTANAGEIYTIILGGNNGVNWNQQFDGYKLSISTPSAVPVPGAVWLFGSALIGLVGAQRRKQLAP